MVVMPKPLSVPPAGGLSVALERDFGSIENWNAEFTSLAKSMGGGSGSAILAWSPQEAKLINHWAGDHTQLLAGASTLLALDMHEHAYHIDFGAKAGAYVDAFMAAIRWDAVAAAYASAMDTASAGLGMQVSEVATQTGAVILDVRRRAVFELAPEQIAGAEWRDPARVSKWLHEFDNAGPVIVYCVHGHEISRSVALALKARGIVARYLIGGVQAWREARLPMVLKPRPR